MGAWGTGVGVGAIVPGFACTLALSFPCVAAAPLVGSFPVDAAPRAGHTPRQRSCLARTPCARRCKRACAATQRRSCRMWVQLRAPRHKALPDTIPLQIGQTWQDLPGGSQEQRKKLANAEDVARLAAQQGVPVSPVSKADLGNLLGHRFHQGVALRTSPLEAGRVTGDKLPGGAREIEPSLRCLSALTGHPRPATPLIARRSTRNFRPGRWTALCSPGGRGHRPPRAAPLPSGPFPAPRHSLPLPTEYGRDLAERPLSGACWPLPPNHPIPPSPSRRGEQGCPHVLISARHTSSLSPVVASTSSGAVDLLVAARRLWRCQSVPRTLSSAQAAGWQVIGADASAEAVPLDALSGAVDVQTPTVLVLVRGRSHIPVPFPASHVAQGSEGYGLRHAVRRLCDSFVAIAGAMPWVALSPHSRWSRAGRGRPSFPSPSPLPPPPPGSADMQQGETRPTVDSLNVSVAAGVLLHSARAAWGWT